MSVKRYKNKIIHITVKNMIFVSVATNEIIGSQVVETVYNGELNIKAMAEI